MSNAIFPMLPGLAWAVKRAPGFSSKQQRSASGATTSAEFYSAPIVKWSFQYEFLRRGQGYAEVDAILAFFRSHRGKHETFLLRDPEDDSVTDMGFGIGNGVTTAFQLQRAIVGTFVRSGQYGASQLLPTKPRTNLVINSQDTTAWNVSNSGTGIAPARTQNYCVAPDGTLTADRVVLDIGAGTTVSDLSLMSTTAVSTVIGQTYTMSVWLRNNDAGNKAIRIDPNGTSTIITVTPVWQRFSIPLVSSAAGAHNLRFMLMGNLATDKYADISVWGAQIELGSVATDYIVTTASAVTVSPAYWPASADGFEPVYTVDEVTQMAQIYQYDWANQPVLMSRFPRTNLVLQSQTLDSATWLKQNGGTGTIAVVTANYTNAPDGTATAERVQLDRVAGVTGADFSQVQSGVLTLVIGKTYTLSFYAKSNPGTVVTLRADAGLTLSGLYYDINGSWQRISYTFVATSASTHRLRIGTTGNLPTSAALDLAIWGAQVEEGTSAGWYIPTVAATVSATDYTLSSAGLVTFATAPRLNATLSWTGAYFWRVRFLQDAAETEQFMSNLYNWKKVEMETAR